VADPSEEFWSREPKELLEELSSSESGLSSSEAAARLSRYGPNTVRSSTRRSTFSLLVGQFKSPIILILIGAAILSIFLKDTTTAIIILVIVAFSGLLGFWQEKGAVDAVQRLLEIVRIKSTVLRDSKETEVPVEDMVPGDVVRLTAGSIVPADAIILSSRDLYVDEATLTGETFPVEKLEEVLPADTPLAKRSNSLFMGTHVVSGSAAALVVSTGKSTEFGRVSERLRSKPDETEFEQGIRHFGYLLMEITLVLVILIFAINVAFNKPVLDSFLFSLALAVGLTPQLLPAIISVNLSKGARVMASHKVIVKRLASIENLGSMNIFCSDKTGTLTEGKVRLDSSVDIDGGKSERTMLYAYLNSSFETGFANPIDDAIRAIEIDREGYEKLDEVPYDFKRRRLSILVEKSGGAVLISKGATDGVLESCTKAEKADRSIVDIAQVKDSIEERYTDYSNDGLRTLGVAYKDIDGQKKISAADEKEMVFLGLVTLFDPPKKDIEKTVKKLEDLGVRLKMITGDNRLVAASVGRAVGLEEPKVLTGEEMHGMSESALARRVDDVDIFAEVEPNQKEHLIKAMMKAGNTVGYMGDGINDAPALHAADASLSVDSGVDVAKEAADFVLLEKDLDVLIDGVKSGRDTFANTMKYVFMATSANFGNMFSMAGASLFLKFLPLLPGQVLLTNLMTDFPEITIATDRVDPELIETPHRWDISFIKKFMLVFGLLSSVFDFATFGVLLLVLNANEVQFHTGWFIESVISASIIVLVIRTRRPFYKSRPSKYLFTATILVGLVVLALPYTPLAHWLGFKPLPAIFYPLLFGIVVLYIASAEIAKKYFYRWVKW
jgi:P-type Mg2+ transporter